MVVDRIERNGRRDEMRDGEREEEKRGEKGRGKREMGGMGRENKKREREKRIKT